MIQHKILHHFRFMRFDCKKTKSHPSTYIYMAILTCKNNVRNFYTREFTHALEINENQQIIGQQFFSITSLNHLSNGDRRSNEIPTFQVLPG